jgi:hypothetical protein
MPRRRSVPNTQFRGAGRLLEPHRWHGLGAEVEPINFGLLVWARARSITHRCLPRVALDSMPLRAMRGAIPR